MCMCTCVCVLAGGRDRGTCVSDGTANAWKSSYHIHISKKCHGVSYELLQNKVFSGRVSEIRQWKQSEMSLSFIINDQHKLMHTNWEFAWMINKYSPPVHGHMNPHILSQTMPKVGQANPCYDSSHFWHSIGLVLWLSHMINTLAHTNYCLR